MGLSFQDRARRWIRWSLNFASLCGCIILAIRAWQADPKAFGIGAGVLALLACVCLPRRFVRTRAVAGLFGVGLLAAFGGVCGWLGALVVLGGTAGAWMLARLNNEEMPELLDENGRLICPRCGYRWEHGRGSPYCPECGYVVQRLPGE